MRTLLRWCVVAVLLVCGGFAALVLYDWLRPPVSTLMMGRRLTGQPVERQWVPLAAISPNLIAAVLMSEDGQFCVHRGVDWDALNSVINDPDGPSRGASTIPMQTAKNLFLWPGRSYIRKAMEIPVALGLSAIWSKKRILEAYLNIAEWGEGLFGAEAAARRYFKKSAAQLSTREAALLATALPNPRLRNPQRPTRTQRNLAVIVMERARSAGPWTNCVD